jgi:glycosyltransferase involved in cell wall biosynthesis
MKVSIIIPAKNEEACLPDLLQGLRRVASTHPEYAMELIVVNDHSTDRTAEVSRTHGAIVVDNPGKPGKGRALITGFKSASGDYLIMMDADGSHLPEFVPDFVHFLDKGYGLVIGSRQLGGSDEYTFLRSLGNIFLSGVFNLITGNHITDVLNGYKGFRREVFTRYPYRSGEFEIEIELVANALKAGYRIGEFACHEKERAGGVAKSKVIRHGTRFLWKILQLTIPYRLSRIGKKATQ